MRTALITTTINVPTVLELYRRHGPDVAFFVAGDQKSPHDEIEELANRVGGYFRYLRPDAQTQWKCSELISWGCIQRRNIALLEAIRWGAEIIVSIDDDNIPMDGSYFSDFWGHIFNVKYVRSKGEGYTSPTDVWEWQITGPRPFNGFKVSGEKGWFDVGALLDPASSHRGYPIDRRFDAYRVDGCVDVRVGVAAGICLGDPDISATTRIERYPTVHRTSELLNSGIVVDPSTKTVFNSQNTAFIRELAPAMFMMPGVGRYDDIYASLICGRVMRPRNLHVHFGKPFVWQQRNLHNLVKDLRAEIDGIENVERFAEILDIKLEVGASVRDHVAQCYNELENEAIVPKQSTDAAFAFLEDIEQVL